MLSINNMDNLKMLNVFYPDTSKDYNELKLEKEVSKMWLKSSLISMKKNSLL